MPELQLLRADHARAVLDFETTNRAFFATSITDRGEDFFAHFAEHHRARLDEQSAGLAAYHVLVEPDGSVVGRVNLIFAQDDFATLGYRIAEAAAGHGLATAAVREVCLRAEQNHGIRRVVASTSEQNVASQRVLAKAGFTRVGPAAAGDVGGKPGYRYELDLTGHPEPGRAGAGART